MKIDTTVDGDQGSVLRYGLFIPLGPNSGPIECEAREVSELVWTRWQGHPPPPDNIHIFTMKS